LSSDVCREGQGGQAEIADDAAKESFRKTGDQEERAGRQGQGTRHEGQECLYTLPDNSRWRMLALCSIVLDTQLN
jgi:hypothetical protein